MSLYFVPPFAKGLTLEQTVEELANIVLSWRARIGAQDLEEFKGYFLEVFVKRAFRELDAPLGELPDGSEITDPSAASGFALPRYMLF